MSEQERERRAHQRAASKSQPDVWSRKAERPRSQPLTLTIAHASEITGLGVSTIWRLIKQGRLNTTSVGRRRLIFFNSLEALLSKDAAA